MLVNGTQEALLKLGASADNAGIPKTTHHLIHARASQINGCSVCLDMHTRELRHAGEPDQRIFTHAAWREAPYFTDAERAALGLTEAVTRLADRPDPVPDAVWEEAARHFQRSAARRACGFDRNNQRMEPPHGGHQTADRRLRRAADPDVMGRASRVYA